MLSLTLSALGAGCGDEAGDGPGATMPCYPPDPAVADGDPEALYAASDVPRFDFRLRDETWAALQENALEEEYVEAEACYRGSSLGLVGLRFKGGYGTLEMCVKQPEPYPCPKLSMKVKLDEYVDGKRFFRQKRLNLHSMVRDRTKLHERLAYGLYRDMGVVAPRSAWATMYVNGEPLGLFAMVEEVDGRFTENQFPEGPDGNVYKAAWPVSTDPAYYADKIETNEEEATHERFVAFAKDLESTEGAERLAALSTWMDVEELQRYMAVDDAILNWDGVTTFYVDDDVDEEGSVADHSANHNYFIYEAPSSGKFHIVPWDMDNTLSVWSWRFFGTVPHWTETPDDCDAAIPVQEGHAHVRAPGCDVLFSALREDPEGYRSAVRDLLEGPFREGRLEEQVDRYAALIRSSVAEDRLGPSLLTWNEDVAILRSELSEMRRRMERLLDGAASAERGD
ncbi:CotH kinase family protein [Sorangium sp. So ce1335]|uniref:CotH kinase family protein n=1 Tax=Sorangium sp. So ce1335 TaxID=3133335 RepID=UPI003F641697